MTDKKEPCNPHKQWQILIDKTQVSPSPSSSSLSSRRSHRHFLRQTFVACSCGSSWRLYRNVSVFNLMVTQNTNRGVHFGYFQQRVCQLGVKNCGTMDELGVSLCYQTAGDPYLKWHFIAPAPVTIVLRLRSVGRKRARSRIVRLSDSILMYYCHKTSKADHLIKPPPSRTLGRKEQGRGYRSPS